MNGFQVYFAHWVSHVHMMAIPALFAFLPEFYGVGYLELGLGVTVFMLVTLVFQVPAGFWVDRYGAKRMLGLGLFVSVVAFAILALIPNYAVYILMMGVLGFVSTVYHPADYSILAQITAPSRLGRAFSYHNFAGNVGTATAPALMLVSANIGGAPLAYLVAGLLPLIAMYLLEPLHRVWGQGRYYLFDHVITERRASSKGDLTDAQWRKQRLRLLTQIVVMTLFFTLAVVSIRPFEQFGQTAFILGYGFSEVDAATLITVMLFTVAAGVLIGGRLADATTRHSLIAALGYLVASGMTLMVAFIHVSFVLLLVVLMLIGFMVGMIAPSRDMMVKKISPPGTEGRVFATVSTGYHIGGAVVPLYLGWVLDHGFSEWVFISAAIGMVGVVLVTLAQEVLFHPTRERAAVGSN